MTAAEWHTTDDLLLLLQAAEKDGVPERRLRLFMLKCCKSVAAPLAVTTLFERAVEYLRAAGQLSPRTIQRLQEAIQAERVVLANSPGAHLWCEAAEMAGCAPITAHTAWQLVATLLQASSDEDLPPIALRQTRKYADLLREVIRPPDADSFQKGWRTEIVRLLADGIHTDRAYDHLPILADALEEAGCDNIELLNHCRGPGPHVLGCWALDLVRDCY